MTLRRATSASPFELRYGFCRAIRVGNRIEVAGTAPIPQDGSDPPIGAGDQMLLCGEIVLSALAELDADAGHVVRTRMFIVDTEDAEDVGRAHATLFGANPPVATMVVVASLLDPRWKVELEAEALVD